MNSRIHQKPPDQEVHSQGAQNFTHCNFFFNCLEKYGKEKLGFSAIFILDTGEHVLWQTVKTQMKCHKFLIFSGCTLHTKINIIQTPKNII